MRGVLRAPARERRATSSAARRGERADRRRIGTVEGSERRSGDDAQRAAARGAARARRVGEELVEPAPTSSRGARPVSTPRWPPGAVSSRTSGAFGSSVAEVVTAARGASTSLAPATASTGTRTLGEVDLAVAVVEVERAVGEVVDAEEAVVELAHRAPGVGVHVVHEVVDRLDLREELAVVEVGERSPAASSGTCRST